MKVKILALLLAVLLVACGQSEVAAHDGRSEFDAFLSDVNQVRRAVQPWTEAEKALIGITAGQSYFTVDLPPSLVTETEIGALITTTGGRRQVTAEQAAADVDLFFRALKTAYGAYDYCGGDEVFLPIRDKVLARLTESGQREEPNVFDHRQRESAGIRGGPRERQWTTNELGDILRQALSGVISDGHFEIGSQAVSSYSEMYYVPDLYFEAGEVPPGAFTRPTIGPDGQLMFCFAALSRNGRELPAETVVAGEVVPLNWVRAENLSVQERLAYQEKRRDGVPFLICRTLSATEENREDLEQLANCGAKYREAPLFMLDLRANKGGNDSFANRWIAGFAGAEVQSKYLYCRKLSTLLLRAFETSFHVSMEELWSLEGKMEVRCTEGTVLPNENLVFVLQDANTASSGESFVVGLHGLENVIFVGGNTAGCTMMGNVIDLKLPNSGLPFRFGGNLAYVGTTDNIEGIGLLPDLWVPPREAEDAVLRLIRYYGLNK